MEDIMEDNFEKLNLLLEQEQCEFVDIPDGFTGQTESGELRLIYLMNDAVESFLILKNARMTGNYVRDYEGEFEGSIEKADRDLCEAECAVSVSSDDIQRCFANLFSGSCCRYNHCSNNLSDFRNFC